MIQRLGLQDLDVNNKRVLLRVDFNVPLDKSGAITDDTRIKEVLPTIQMILDRGGSVILMSHLGRPKGKDTHFTLQDVGRRLAQLLSKPVQFSSDAIGKEVEIKTNALKSGEILLLENLRFYPAEEEPQKDENFAKQLARLGDMYVNDAFGTAHREHSSTATIAQYFPGKAAAGLLMQKEISFFTTLMHSAKSPFYAIIGGAKISTKIGVLRSLLSKVDGLLIGGGMAYTFLKAEGIEIGDSLFEEKNLKDAKEFIEISKEKNIPLYFPIDLVVANAFDKEASSKIISTQEGIPAGWQGMDIGPETIKAWVQVLAKANTVFWNGPLGVFEFPQFATGTNAVAKAVSEIHGTTVVGGGDSVAAINALGIAKKFSHISTGGGASLEFLEFGQLPGINALTIK